MKKYLFQLFQLIGEVFGRSDFCLIDKLKGKRQKILNNLILFRMGMDILRFKPSKIGSFEATFYEYCFTLHEDKVKILSPH